MLFRSMNKNDWILIIIIIFISLSLLLFFKLTNQESNQALVYNDNKLILTIDLTKDDKYQVMGLNGEVDIEVKNNQIRVTSETSNYHLCSKQGYISKSWETIVCLPNKIIIRVTSLDNNYDVILR